MKIVNVIGGLGNQLFQYAFAVALKVHNPDENILLDTSHFHSVFFKKYKGRNLHYGYEIDKILDNVIIPLAKPGHLIRVTNYVPNYLLSRFVRRYFPKRKSEYIEKQDFTFDTEALCQNGDRYYEGYWQAADYFYGIEDKIREAFKFKPLDKCNMEWVNRLQNQCSVSVHVRRGDYVTNKGFGGICDLDYYTRAIKYVIRKIENPIFYVFSNDIKWCEENIKPLMNGAECVFVNHNKGKDSYKDMELMSYCHTNIIANSSFSWWGAFLNHNDNALVIAPQKWNNHFDKVDTYCKIWVRL